MLILATLIAFRLKREALGLAPSPIRLPGAPYTPALGIVALIVILAAAFEVDLDIAWKAGVPYLVGITIAYVFVRWLRRPPEAEEPTLLELELKARVPSG
jgi:hypothetical protein